MHALHLHAEYDPVLVLLSVTVAILGSWTGMDLFRRALSNRGTARTWWLAATAAGMGLSIWAMHFVAMLSFSLDQPVAYDPALTALSLLVAIVAAGIAFTLIASPAPSATRISVAGTTLGSGLFAMHYTGMAALQTGAVAEYQPALVVLSAVIAIGAGVAVMLFTQAGAITPLRAALGATLLGLATASMHFTAMQAVSFVVRPGASLAVPGLPTQALALTIGAGTLLLLFLALVAAMFDRRFEALEMRDAQRARAGEDRLRRILAQLPVGVVVTMSDGELLLSNDEAVRVLGYPPASRTGLLPGAPGEAPPLHGPVHSDGTPFQPDEYALTRALRRGETFDREQQLHRRDDGSIRTLEISAAPVRDESGAILLGVATFQDVSVKLQAEEALRRSQRLEAVGQLTGGVAHDFNNLLTAILANLDMVGRHVQGERPRRMIENATRAAERGAALTRQLLAFARKQQLDPQAVGLNDLVAGMQGLLESTLSGTVRVSTGLALDLWPAMADPTQLEMVVLNLALNARDAMPDGGNITIRTANVVCGARQRPEEPQPGEYVRLSITDTGTGMPPDVRDRIFEPFFTTKEIGRGSGLGLAQVLGIAQQLGGGVRVETAPGAGTTIEVYLPRAHRAVDAPSESAPQQPVRLLGRRILVVDDDRDVRTAIVTMLHELGCAVEEAASGRTAWQVLQYMPEPDAVLMDFAMPGMNGIEAAIHLRELVPDLPVLMMTGYADEAAFAGTDSVLRKPFRAGELGAALLALLPGSNVLPFDGEPVNLAG